MNITEKASKDPYPTVLSYTSALFNRAAITSYGLVRYVLERDHQTEWVEFFQAQEQLVILDLFSGNGYVPLFVLHCLAKNNAISPSSSIEIHTVSLTGVRKYDNNNLAEIRSGGFVRSEESEEDNAALSDGSLTDDLLQRTSVHHHSGNVFDFVQNVADDQVTIATLFSCSEAFFDKGIYVESNGVELAKRIRDNHFARVLKDGAFLFQGPGCGPVSGLNQIGDSSASYFEYPVVSRKPL